MSTFEHPLWKETFNLLNPEFNVPSRKMLATSGLETEHAKVKQQINEKISKAVVLHMAVDGWSNIRNESILNIIIYTPEPVFYTFVETKTNRHKADYLTSELSKVIEEIGEDRFFAVVTDNAANMAKCGRSLCNKFDKMIWIGCIAHTLNLLVGDVLRKTCVKEIFEFVVAVIKNITQSHILTAEFRKHATEKSITVSLVLPVKTRWGSYLHCLDIFLKSKRILQTMAVNDEISELERHKLQMLDETSWSQIDNHRKFLKPIVEWTTRLEADYSTIHLVQQALKEIGSVFEDDDATNIFSTDDLEDLRLKFKQREGRSLQPIHYAADILNPTSQGSTLSPEDHIKGCQMIVDTIHNFFGHNNVQAVLVELSEFKAQRGNFENKMIWEQKSTLPPSSWWQLFFSNSLLGKVALNILSVPSTSASVERSFSTFAHIHNKKRNRLTANRAGKLCFVAHNWKLLNSVRKPSNLSTSLVENENNSSSDEEDSSFELDPLLFMSVTDSFEMTSESEHIEVDPLELF